MSEKDQQELWEQKGSITVEDAILAGLFEGATEVVGSRLEDGMYLVYSNGKIGLMLLDEADIDFVRDFIYDMRALHDSRLNLGNRVDEHDRRVSTLDVGDLAPAECYRLDLMRNGRQFARLWIEDGENDTKRWLDTKVTIEPIDTYRVCVQGRSDGETTAHSTYLDDEIEICFDMLPRTEKPTGEPREG